MSSMQRKDAVRIHEAPAATRAAELNETNGRRSTNSSTHLGGVNRCAIAAIVYFALLLDNMLLTVIVPILPDYLATINNRTYSTSMDLFHTNSNTNNNNNNNNNVAHNFIAIGSGGGVGGATKNVAYRNFDNIQTKHPIPGKSMVNFSLFHATAAANAAAAAAAATANAAGNDKAAFIAPIEQKPTRHVVNDTNAIAAATTLTKSSMTGNNTGANTDNSHTNVTNSTAAIVVDAAQTAAAAAAAADDSLASENGSIGLLLAMKALVQLIFNPIVGNMSTKFGYRLPIVMGTFCLLMSSLVFAVGETYLTLLLARAIQGIGSACIGVCGMSLVAQHYPEEDRRSKVMGIILGSIALGVLLGYPFGGILYDLVGKSAPFIILSAIIFLNLGLQLVTMDLSVTPEIITNLNQSKRKWKPLLECKMILAIVIAIWFSTSTMAILEPCLPIWLMEHLKPNKWQLGTVFIPDSLGYFVGTNFFGCIAYKYGQVKISCMSLMLVGISSILIPSAINVTQLLLPHFGLGLGIGIIDAALVPLLATFVDATLMQDEQSDTSNVGSMNSMSSYGTVYAIQQTSVSLAYCLAPLLGGEMAQVFGFAWLMRIVGFFNIIYGPILVYLHQKYDPKLLHEKQNELLLTNAGHSSQYKQLYNSIDNE